MQGFLDGSYMEGTIIAEIPKGKVLTPVNVWCCELGHNCVLSSSFSLEEGSTGIYVPQFVIGFQAP